ncbi:MAG: hypothetical protein AB7K04_05920 [Pseudorhodoplanes sp.]
MIKSIAKCVLAASLVAAAISVSVTPSFAAKKKGMKAKPAAACMMPSSVRNCTNGVCNISWCGADGKYYPTPIFCIEPFCISPRAS